MCYYKNRSSRYPLRSLPLSTGLVLGKPLQQSTGRKTETVKAYIKNKMGQLTRSLPFRMAAGRLGIWLMKVGRVLQVRYANWNYEFRLRTEILAHPDFCHINVSHKLTTNEVGHLFTIPEQGPVKMTAMLVELFAVKGVAKIAMRPFQMTIEKGSVFEWSELLPEVEAIMLKHLTPLVS